VTVESQQDIDGILNAGRVVARVRDAMLSAVEPGMTTAELDGVGEELLARFGARSAPRITTADWMLGSFWAHPERVLDAGARAATSGFARLPPEVVDRVVAEISRDLASGSWDERYGHLRALDALDVGLRLVVAT